MLSCRILAQLQQDHSFNEVNNVSTLFSFSSFAMKRLADMTRSGVTAAHTACRQPSQNLLH